MPAVAGAVSRSAGQKAATVRKDPVFRPVDGMGDWTALKNKDPNRHYVWVNKEDTFQGPSFYLSQGVLVDGEELRYNILEKGDGDAEPVVGCGARKNGDQWEFRGYVLMGCDKRLYNYVQEYGVNGQSGLKAMRDIEDRIHNKDAARRIATGVRTRSPDGSSYFDIDNETSRGTAEVAPPKE